MPYLVAQHTKTCNEEGCYLEGTVTLYDRNGTKIGGYCNIHKDEACQEQINKEANSG